MLTSATRGETLTPNPNKCNSTLTSGTRGIYPYLYIAEESVPCAKFKCSHMVGHYRFPWIFSHFQDKNKV